MTSSLLDLTMDDAQNSQFRGIYHTLIRDQVKNRVFTEVEAKCLLIVFHKFTLNSSRRTKFMTRRQFSTFFHSFFNMLEPNIIDGLLSAASPESNTLITPKAYLNLMAVLAKGSLDQRIQLCFKTYDTQGNGYLTKEKLRKYFRNGFVGESEDLEEITTDFVDIIMRKMDLDRDGRISFEDYAESVKENPCLLQFMGTCIPDLVLLESMLKVSNVPFTKQTVSRLTTKS